MPDVIRARLGRVTVGDGLDVAVAGAVNVSPESFYAGSVAGSADALLRTAEAMLAAGAALIDVGAMSTAPYGGGAISADEEALRLACAVDLLVTKLDAPVSADTSRVLPARSALAAGACVVNDVTGLSGDPAMAALVAASGAGLILMASEAADPSAEPVVGRTGPPRGRPSADAGAPGRADPIATVGARLAEGLAIARRAGIVPDRIALDPGIGFFRRQALAWHEWDCRVLAGLARLRGLGHPLCVGVSRKSFIGALAGEPDPGLRLPGSLAAGTAAVLGGAHLIRTHDVAETVQAVRVAQAIRRAGS